MALLAEPTKNSAEHVLFLLQHPDATAASTRPASAVSAAASANLGLPKDPRQRQPVDPNAGVQDQLNRAAVLWERHPPSSTPPPANIDMGGIVMSTLHDAQSIGAVVTNILTTAWDTAMNGHPVSGTLGGGYRTRGGPSCLAKQAAQEPCEHLGSTRW